MFTFLRAKSLWIGMDIKRMNQIRDALDAAGIPHKVKTRNRMGQWAGRGTLRGRTGSLGIPTEQMYEYEIFVLKPDCERAKFLLGLR